MSIWKRAQAQKQWTAELPITGNKHCDMSPAGVLDKAENRISSTLLGKVC